jgi:hypothetical protein
MNILTFDIEDWYLSNPLPENTDWNKYEVRIYEGIKIILTPLEGDFFVWVTFDIINIALRYFNREALLITDIKNKVLLNIIYSEIKLLRTSCYH